MCYSTELGIDNIYYNDYKDLSDRDLHRKKDILNDEYYRCIGFSTLYSIAAIGTLIATFATFGTSAAGTIPAAAVSSVAAGDNIDKTHKIHCKMEIIDKILYKRKKSEVKIFKNKNALSIVSSDLKQKYN